jgi:hypothetical protein
VFVTGGGFFLMEKDRYISRESATWFERIAWQLI